MKLSLYYAMLVLIITISCSIPPKSVELENWENKTEKEEIISEIEESEFYSGIRNDTIFFNLSFGLTPSEAEKVLKKLQKHNVVSNIKKHNAILSVDFNINHDIYCNFGKAYCFFENEKLSELQIDTTNQLKSNLIDLFVEKYGEYNYFTAIDGNFEYHWIQGNRHISITQLGESKNLLILFKDTTQTVNDRNTLMLQRFSKPVCTAS